MTLLFNNIIFIKQINVIQFIFRFKNKFILFSYMNNLSYTDLKTYPLESTKMYSFVYNNQAYLGEFIGKKNKSIETEFLFKEFVINIHSIQPFNVLFLKECNSVCSDEPFSDSDSDSDSECVSEVDELESNIIDEYDIIENEDSDYFFC